MCCCRAAVAASWLPPEINAPAPLGEPGGCNAGAPTNKTMNPTQLDRITAAAERYDLLGKYPQAEKTARLAQALGISEEMVREALEQEQQA